MFRLHLDECRTVHEATSYVEMFNYTVSMVDGIGRTKLRELKF